MGHRLLRIFWPKEHGSGRRRKATVIETYVLDTFAILVLLGREPGNEKVSHLLRHAETGEIRLLMPWVNAGEMAYIVERRWGQRRLSQVLASLARTAMEFVPVERGVALAAAHIKAMHPIAYADAFAAALAEGTGAILITGDPEFEQLQDTLRIQWVPRSE
jgi:predicted nucleic acid-binding protein